MDYQQLLQQLKDGQIDQFEIKPDQYFDFQKSWQDFKYQQEIRGIAKIGGIVTYVRQSDNGK